jgi:hypothetical protein
MQIGDLTTVLWIVLVILCDTFCAIITLLLMGKHLKSREKRAMPKSRYITVLMMIVIHSALDVVAIISYAVANMLPRATSSEQIMYSTIRRVSTSMTAFHVAFFPVVYIHIRDLKFRDEIKQRQRMAGSSKKGVSFTKNSGSVQGVPAVKSQARMIEKL